MLGIACLILALAVGAGFSGVVLFSYYQYKLNQTNDRVNTLISGYKKQFANAEGDLAAAAAAAKANIQNQLKALQQIQAGPATLAALIKQVAPSVYFVHTLDANGQAVGGDRLRGVVQRHPVAAPDLLHHREGGHGHARARPSTSSQDNTDTPVTVRSWDPQYDLALLVLPQGGLPRPPGRHPVPGPAARRPDLRGVRPGIGRGVDLPGHRHRRLGQRGDRGRRHRPGLPGRTADQPGRRRGRGGVADLRPVRLHVRWGLVCPLCRGGVQQSARPAPEGRWSAASDCTTL